MTGRGAGGALAYSVQYSPRAPRLPPALSRPPGLALRPFVKALWASDVEARPSGISRREWTLPTGEMHLVFRLSEEPVRLYEGPHCAAGHAVGLSAVAGMRDVAYLREMAATGRTVGVQLHPGVSPLLFGARADELAGRHWALDDFWGAEAGRVRDRLLEVGSGGAQLDVLERLLAARLPRARGLHPAVALALERLGAAASVGEVVRESGRSHRTFISLFRHAMGLSPKVYCRVQRFQRVIRRLAAEPRASWADVAVDAGYSDQPHLAREFRQLAGITPGEYRALAGRGHHVPLRPARP